FENPNGIQALSPRLRATPSPIGWERVGVRAIPGSLALGHCLFCARADQNHYAVDYNPLSFLCATTRDFVATKYLSASAASSLSISNRHHKNHSQNRQYDCELEQYRQKSEEHPTNLPAKCRAARPCHPLAYKQSRCRHQN